MSDKELADRVVALGVGRKCGASYSVRWNQLDDDPVPAYTLRTSTGFVSDWRVAGALIEKCKVVSWTETTTGGSYVHARAKQNGYGEQSKGQVARAIIEACCTALEKK